MPDLYYLAVILSGALVVDTDSFALAVIWLLAIAYGWRKAHRDIDALPARETV